MDMLILSFVIAWCLRHWWDGRKKDYRRPDNDYRSRVRGATQRHAGQRYAAGWAAWQLRHGWGPMAQDVKDGWDGARKATQDWRNGEGERPGFAQAWRDGWKGGAMPAIDPARPAADQKPAIPEPQPTPTPAPTIVVINNPNGGTMTTPTMAGAEITSLDAYRRLLEQAVATATARVDEAARNVTEAEQEIGLYDAAQASLAANGLGAQTTGGLAELLESAQARKARAEQARSRAEIDLATARDLLAALTRTGQDAMQEAVNAATERANNTQFYAAS